MESNVHDDRAPTPVQVTGARIVPGARYVQLVGATLNKPNAVPQPGTAVYKVLSGSFDLP
jgi:hypothetical protein